MSKNANTFDINPITIDDLDDLTNTMSASIAGANIIGAIGSSTSYNWTAGANGTSVIDWGNISITGATVTPMKVNQSGTIELTGEDADIRVNGRSLMDAIDALEQRLNILVPNPELEAEWDELRELSERYRELEKKCKEKGDMWKKLKQMPPPEIK
jgi:hypothetical protein